MTIVKWMNMHNNLLVNSRNKGVFENQTEEFHDY